MRHDDAVQRRSFLGSEEWSRDPESGETDPIINARVEAGDEVIDGKLKVHALSGHERNHLFLNDGGGNGFTDVSALSALDDVADSRTFALLDYDRDGWQDIFLINASNPLSRLYRNELGTQGRIGGMIALRFVGGNSTASASQWSNRDGYGARIEVHRGDEVIIREHRCGEGFAAQNSRTMIVGIGEWKEVDKVEVHWPSGKTSTTTAVPEGMLLTVHEKRESDSFLRSRYRQDRIRLPETAARTKFPLEGPKDGVRVYTTMATWCASCIAHLPELRQLTENGVELIAVPVDKEDDAAKLSAYVDQWKPPYTLLAEASAADREAVRALFAKAQDAEEPVSPSSAIVDSDGNVREFLRGIPSLSQVRRWIAPPLSPANRRPGKPAPEKESPGNQPGIRWCPSCSARFLKPFPCPTCP